MTYDATASSPQLSPGQLFNSEVCAKNAVIGDRIRAEISGLLDDQKNQPDTDQYVANCKSIELLSRALAALRA